MADNTKSPSDEDKDSKPKDTAPDSGESGQADTSTEAPSKLPDKLKGKSPDEIAKMYVNAQQKLGKMSGEVSEARKLKEQTDTMLRAIWSDPDLYRQVENGIRKYVKGETLPDTSKKTKKSDKKKDDGEADKKKESPEVADLRRSEENRVLSDFRKKYGYDNLKPKERQEKFTKTAVVLSELLDPSGQKSTKEIVSNVPLSRLPKYLDYAHQLAHGSGKAKKPSVDLTEEENKSASISSFPASSGKKSKGVTLSNRERETAQKMGISEEKYAKRKKEIEEEYKQYK